MPDAMVRYLVEMTSDPMFTPKWYRQAFAPAPRGMLPLDTTPEYSTLPEAGVDEVAAFLPRAKFIYLLRDPVDRAISQLRMNLARRKVLPTAPKGYLRHLDDAELGIGAIMRRICRAGRRGSRPTGCWCCPMGASPPTPWA